MKLSDLLLVLISVLLSAASQTMLKIGMSSPPIQAAMTSRDSVLQLSILVASSPWVVIGLALFGASAITWLLVLGSIDLSSAYPFVALGIALTTASSYFLLGEAIGVQKLTGVLVIVLGVLLVGFA